MGKVKVTVKRDRNICFEPLKNFKWFREDDIGQKFLIADYQPGFEYNCSVKPVHDVLAKMIPIWEKEGKIEVRPSKRLVRVVAKGVVTDKKEK